MYECHGWFVLSTDAYEQETNAQNEAVLMIEATAKAACWPDNYLFEVRRINGMAVLVIEAQPNHAESTRKDILYVLRRVAELAPASYGLLYIRDDEDPEGITDFQVYAMRRGKLDRCADPFLSPVIPTIEDPEPEQ